MVALVSFRSARKSSCYCLVAVYTLTMEVLFNRFSSLGKDILSNLDDISLATFKESSRELSNLFELERIYLITGTPEVGGPGGHVPPQNLGF